MRLILEGYDLPGRTACVEGGAVLHNVHVGVQVRKDPEHLVPADVEAVRWELDIEVAIAPDGGHDFRGPEVHGNRDDRFLYLTWGDVDGDGGFAMFMRAKLMLSRIHHDLIEEANTAGHQLVGRIKLSDALGLPRCARVDPPDLIWAVSHGRADVRAARRPGSGRPS